MKAVVPAFNQEKALVGAISVITNLRMDLFEALISTAPAPTFSTLSSVYWRTDTSGAQWHSQVAECKLTNNLQQKVGSLNSHEPKVLLAAEEMRRCKGKKATMPEWHRRTKLQTSGQRGWWGGAWRAGGRGTGTIPNTNTCSLVTLLQRFSYP